MTSVKVKVVRARHHDAMPTLTIPRHAGEQPPRFDADLIRRYNVNGPRYTSYPAAPQFHAGFGAEEYRAAVRLSNEDPIPRPLSLYVHVPFCFSPCFYCGCTRIITRDTRRADEYINYLDREAALVAPLFDRDRPVVQLHFGGGTPNFLDATQMGRLMDHLKARFSLQMDDEREFGIEVDPRFADADSVRMLAAHGFNRLSLGIQDFDPEVQVAVNRIQGYEPTRVVIDTAREAGFRSVSVDLIYGLPKQTTAGFTRTLEQVIALKPDRIATYAYAHMPQLFKAQGQIDAEDLPDAATRLALLGVTVETLTAAGYRYIGMDHFALPDDDLARAQRAGTLQRNFQGYSTHAQCDLIGLGMSSIGRVGNSFVQSVRDLTGYYAMLDAGHLPVYRGLQLSDDDLIRADAIQQLMCHGRLDIPAFEARHQLRFEAFFARTLAQLRPLHEDGLIELDTQRITVSARGRLLLRNIAMCFDSYRSEDQVQARYSRAL